MGVAVYLIGCEDRRVCPLFCVRKLLDMENIKSHDRVYAKFVAEASPGVPPRRGGAGVHLKFPIQNGL